MKLLPILFILTICSLLSGCIDFEVVDTYHYTKYPLYYNLESISTTLPTGVSLPTYVNLTLTYPDGRSKGIHKVHTNTQFPVFNLRNHTLYQTGIYTAKYETKDIIKYDYFFVGTIDSRLIFTPTTFTVKNSELDLSIINDGNIDGFLYLVLFNNEPVQIGSKMVYGQYYINDAIYIRNGHYYEYTRLVNSNSLVLLVNGDIYYNDR